MLAAVALAAERRGSSVGATLPDVVRFGLGTTAVTNVLASGAGRRVGLLTTAGFEAMLVFARGARVPDADGWLVRPGQILDRRDVVGIHERIDRDAKVVTPLVTRGAPVRRTRGEDVGVETFAASLRVIRDLTEAEMRRRITAIADGTYRWTSWTEFDDDFFAVPCTLTVDGDRLVFDFAGAAAQTTHFLQLEALHRRERARRDAVAAHGE